jgi:hypothetical protein
VASQGTPLESPVGYLLIFEQAVIDDETLTVDRKKPGKLADEKYVHVKV